MAPALRNAVFRKLAGLYTLNALLDWVGSVALMVVVYNATSSAFVAALMLLCKQVFPGFAVHAAGPKLDRIPLRSAAAWSFGIAAAALAAVAQNGYGVALFALAAIIGLAAAIARSSLRASIARVLPGDQLRGGNAVLNVIIGVVTPVAPAVATLLVALLSPEMALVACAIAFVGLVLAALTLPSLAAARDSVGAEEGAAAHAGTSPSRVPVLLLLLLGGVAVSASAMTEPTMLPFSIHALGAGVAGYGALTVGWAIGVTIGSLLFTRLLHVSMLKVFAGATAVSGIAYIAMGLSPSIEVAVAFAVLGGLGTGMDWVAVVTAVQERAPRGAEAAAAARLESFAMVGPALGVLAGGALADLVSERAAIIAPGVLSLGALCIAGIYLSLRSSRLVSAPNATYVSPTVQGGSA